MSHCTVQQTINPVPHGYGLSNKSKQALIENIICFIERHGIDRVGFVTGTFPVSVSRKKAEMLFKLLSVNVLSNRYLWWIGVIHRSPGGRLHFHALLATDEDIRSGFRFTHLKFARALQRYKSEKARRLCTYFTSSYVESAKKCLRAEWSYWRRIGRKSGLGRTELLPVESTGEAVGEYLARFYDEPRVNEDRSRKSVWYSDGTKVWTAQFSWYRSPVRFKIGKLATMLGITGFDGFRRRFGARWCRDLRPAIELVRLEPRDYLDRRQMKFDRDRLAGLGIEPSNEEAVALAQRIEKSWKIRSTFASRFTCS